MALCTVALAPPPPLPPLLLMLLLLLLNVALILNQQISKWHNATA
jgi:hypothetical protein